MTTEVLSATLPGNEVIRERLLARLRERFGDALFVYRDRIALVADEFAHKEKTFKFGACRATKRRSRAGTPFFVSLRRRTRRKRAQ